MPEKQLLENRRKLVVDVNILAIFLVQNHPGNRYVSPILEQGLAGQFTPLVLDILPLRVYWVMTKRWACDPHESEKAIRHFLNAYPQVEYCRLEHATVHKAFELAKELHHDVFDLLYLAIALEQSAKGIFSTDTDFERLCSSKKLEYHNPVPRSVLRRFSAWQRSREK